MEPEARLSLDDAQNESGYILRNVVDVKRFLIEELKRHGHAEEVDKFSKLEPNDKFFIEMAGKTVDALKVHYPIEYGFQMQWIDAELRLGVLLTVQEREEVVADIQEVVDQISKIPVEEIHPLLFGVSKKILAVGRLNLSPKYRDNPKFTPEVWGKLTQALDAQDRLSLAQNNRG